MKNSSTSSSHNLLTCSFWIKNWIFFFNHSFFFHIIQFALFLLFFMKHNELWIYKTWGTASQPSSIQTGWFVNFFFIFLLKINFFLIFVWKFLGKLKKFWKNWKTFEKIEKVLENFSEIFLKIVSVSLRKFFWFFQQNFDFFSPSSRKVFSTALEAAKKSTFIYSPSPLYPFQFSQFSD